MATATARVQVAVRRLLDAGLGVGEDGVEEGGGGVGGMSEDGVNDGGGGVKLGGTTMASGKGVATGEFAGPLKDVSVAVAEACGGLMQKLQEFSNGRKEGGWVGEGVYVCVM